jgi:hypothetical protein
MVPHRLFRPLPNDGRFGDLYVTLIETRVRGGGSEPKAYMFLCLSPGFPEATPPIAAQWAPFILGGVQEGGSAPVALPTTLEKQPLKI